MSPAEKKARRKELRRQRREKRRVWILRDGEYISMAEDQRRQAKEIKEEKFRRAVAAAVVAERAKQAIQRASNSPDADFYKSRAWREVRYAALVRSDGRCCACGFSSRQGAELHVDHIKPRSLYPALALELDNLQVLCADCNLGKSNKDATDWRSEKTLDMQEYSDGSIGAILRSFREYVLG